jgi:enoyl-CoA hydratase
MSKSPFRVQESKFSLDIQFHDQTSSNALSLGAARDLAALAKSYKKWDRPVVVRSGHPRLFCSGGNLSGYQRLQSKAAGVKINREITNALNKFAAWPVLKLALVNGDVLGGGMEWLARFDLVWSTPHVLFAFWQKRIGLTPGWGGGKIWADRLGENVLRTLLNEARLISAPEAMRLKLVQRVIPENLAGVVLEDWLVTLNTPEKFTGEINRWTAATERSQFERLWMGPIHKSALQKWRVSK